MTTRTDGTAPPADAHGPAGHDGHVGGGLQKSLSPRHLRMIAIGGCIGAGLFVGSGEVLQKTGPGAFISYALSGALVILVMRMLGEMATANPGTGSFSDYARRALGNWAGFSTAWLYWYFWVIIVGFEAVAGARILQTYTGGPLWVISLGLMLLMTATNLVSVRSFGEFEYWFAGIKVVAIILFLGLGTLFVIGLWPGHSMDFSLLTNGTEQASGLFPLGVAAVFSSIVVVVFSMTGAEVATIAAAESKDPARSVAQATRSVIYRISIFFVGSLFLIACIVPWDSPETKASPYAAALGAMGIPFGPLVMNLVVLTAVLSCLNSGLYTSSRMLFVLAERHEAPKALVRVSPSGVPRAAILTSSVVGFLCVVASAIDPDGVFLFLLNSSGAVILFVYLLIAVSQLVLRRRTDPEKLVVKMWLFPVLTVVAIAGIVGVLAAMGAAADSRSQLFLSLGSWAVLLVIYAATAKQRHAARERAEADRSTLGSDARDGAALGR